MVAASLSWLRLFGRIGAFCLVVAPLRMPAQDQDLAREVERLQRENAALKAENQALRRMVFEAKAASPEAIAPSASGTSSPSGSSAAASAERATAKSGANEKSHWLTSSSGKRHNRSCRYFQVSKGRPCAANEGTACKVCGG